MNNQKAAIRQMSPGALHARAHLLAILSYQILTQIGGNMKKPGFFMFFCVQLRLCPEKLDKRILQYFFCISCIMKIGVGKPQNRVPIIVEHTLSLGIDNRSTEHLLCFAIILYHCQIYVQ